MFRDSAYFVEYLARVDAQIKDRAAKKAPGLDRRQKQIPLPEGMEDRRKQQDRRRSRQGIREKEKEE